MLNEQLSKDIELIKFLEEEKRARLENEVTKSAQLVVKIVCFMFYNFRLNTFIIKQKTSRT